MLTDAIEYEDDETIVKWLRLYNQHLDTEYLPEVGYTVSEVQREYLHRFQYQEKENG